MCVFPASGSTLLNVPTIVLIALFSFTLLLLSVMSVGAEFVGVLVDVDVGVKVGVAVDVLVGVVVGVGVAITATVLITNSQLGV